MQGVARRGQHDPVAQGARLDVKDKAGRTPLDVATDMKNVTAVALFRELGAPPKTIAQR